MDKKKILDRVTISWAIISGSFLVLSLLLQPLSGSWSYTLNDPLFVNEENSFNSIAISQDGNYVVAVKFDGILLFSRSNPNPLWNYDQGYRMSAVDTSYDGSYIVVGSGEGKLYLFNKSSSQPIWIYDAGYDNSIIDVEISSDGAIIAASIYHDGIVLFQKESPVPLWSVTGSEMALSSNGEYLAMSTNSNLYLYNTTSSVPLWSYTDNNIEHLAISSTGEDIVIRTTSVDTSHIRLFNYLNSIPIWTFATDNFVQGLDISSDGNYIIAGSMGSSYSDRDLVYFFNKLDSTPLWDYEPLTNFHGFTIEFSGNGEYFLLGEGDRISLFHRSTNIPIWSTPYGWWGSISSSGKEIVTFESNKLFFFNYYNPLLIEDLFISYIIIFSLLGVLSIFHLSKHRKRKKLLKEELARREDLQKILQYSNRVSKKMVRTVLGLDKSSFDEQISKWATEFGFKVDNDYIFINKDEMPEFIKDLDKKFEEWQELQKKKKA